MDVTAEDERSMTKTKWQGKGNTAGFDACHQPERRNNKTNNKI